MAIVSERDALDRLRTLVQKCRTELGVDQIPPYEGPNHPLASLLNIEIREERHVPHGGLYVDSEPPRIAIDPYVSSPERLNFTFFHEVTHRLIRIDGQLYGFLYDHAPERFEDVCEDYCNLGAAEFLIPRANVVRKFQEKGFSMALLAEFDASYPASKPAIAIQMAQCAPHKCIVMICEPKLLSRRDGGLLPMGFDADSEPILKPTLVVSYSSSSPSLKKYRFGVNTRIPKHHIIADAYTQRSSLRGRDFIPAGSKNKWTVDCEAFYYAGKVYAAFNVTSPPSVFQPKLNFRD